MTITLQSPLITALLRLVSCSYPTYQIQLSPWTSVRPEFLEVQNWRNLEVNAFAADFEKSAMFVAPSEDVNTAFDQYDSTLKNLLDKHAAMKFAPDNLLVRR